MTSVNKKVLYVSNKVSVDYSVETEKGNTGLHLYNKAEQQEWIYMCHCMNIKINGAKSQLQQIMNYMKNITSGLGLKR